MLRKLVNVSNVCSCLKSRRTFALLSQDPAKDDQSLWVRSPFESIDTEKISGVTLPELMWSRLPLIEDSRTAFEGGVTKRFYTFNEVYRYSRGFAAALLQARFKRGDILAIILPNYPEYPIITMGALEAGLVITKSNHNSTEYEMEQHLQKSESVGVVTTPSVSGRIKSIAPQVKHIIVVGEPEEGCHNFFEMMKADTTGVEFLKGSQIDKNNDTAIISYSSGTSGPPKGVQLPHSSIVANILQLNTEKVRSWGSAEEKAEDRFLAILPFFHSYAFLLTLATGLYQGAHTYCLPKVENNNFLRAVRHHKPTALHLATPLINFMSKNVGFGIEEFRHIKSIIAGAAPLGKGQIELMLSKAGHYIFFQEGYGMTEMSPAAIVCYPHSKNRKLGSLGLPLPSTVAKVVHIENGRTLGSGQMGELWLKGPQLMKGYRNNEEATKDAIDPDGWLHTGDCVYYDDDGYFYFHDRLKELIKCKGFQVAPSELEHIIKSMPDVADVVVIGIACDRNQEIPRAYIVKANPKLTTSQVHRYVNVRVIDYKRLKGGIVFVNSIPKTASGKSIRKILKDNYVKNNE